MRLIDADALMPNAEYKGANDVVSALDIANAPTIEPTLYGYKIEHLALIARVMQKEGVTPEKAVQVFSDIQAVALMVIDEINGVVERTFEQLTETRGSGDDKTD